MSKNTHAGPWTELLDWSTPDGVFVAAGGEPTYWIIHNYQGRFAVQLDATPERPAFSFQRLSMVASAAGLWMGAVSLRLGAKFEGSVRNRSGLIVRRGFRLHIKANDQSGTGAPLTILPYDLDACHRFSTFYADWRLMSEQNGSICLFQSLPMPPRMLPFEDDSDNDEDEEEEGYPTLTLVRNDRAPHSDGLDGL